MRTHQTQQWRTLLDALKDLVPECSVTFDSEGMKLISMDPAHVALIHLTAKSEVYFCKTVTKVGLNVTALYKVLRGLTSAGFVLEFSITEDNSDFLNVIISNSEKRTCTRTMLKLLRLADEEISIPSTTFQRVLSIPSGDFQRYIRELAGISTQITITSTIDKLVLSASGSMGSTSIEIKPTSGGMHWIHKEANGQDGKVDDDNGEVSGTFLSRYLERFSRPLDLSVDLFIKRNYPLVLRYTMPSACVRLVVASVVQEDEDDINGEE